MINNTFANNDIFFKVEQLLRMKPMQDILDSLGISYSNHSNGDVIRGRCPDHYLYTGRYPSGSTDWVVNVHTGQTFCHTEKRGSNILLIAKRLKNFQTLQQAFDFISDGYKVQDKFEKFISGHKRVGFNPHNVQKKQDRLQQQQRLKFQKKIQSVKQLINSANVNKQTQQFFKKDGISIETVHKFNIVSIEDGYSKYRCLIPFYDHINLNKLVGYVAVNTLSKHEYIKRIGQILFKMKNVKDWKNVRKIYSILIEKYKKAIYLKNSLMRQNLFGLNMLIKQNVDLSKIYLVQGQRDAIKMQQQGFPCVGTHGSHVSVQQLNILRSVGSKTICIMFDSDNAGRQGARKSVQLALQRGFRVFNIDPCGKDPKKYNRQQLLEIINKQVVQKNQWNGLINNDKLKNVFQK